MNTPVYFTEEANGLDFLEKSYAFLSIVSKNPQEWKWVMISLHGALYTFALKAAAGTNGSRVTKKNGWVWGIQLALKDCVLQGFITDSQINDPDVKRFIEEFRGGFEHFQPGSWAILTEGLPRITSKIFVVLKDLLNAPVFFHFEPHEQERLDYLLIAIEKKLEEL